MSGPRSLIVRATAVIAAVGAAAFVGLSQRDEDRCGEAGAQIVRVINGVASGETLPGALRTLRSGCRDSSPLLVAAGVLGEGGRERDALALARLAARREPDNYAPWVVLSRVLPERSPAAERARVRALRLNPLLAR